MARSPWRPVRATLSLDLADNGTGRPVDRERLADQLRASVDRVSGHPYAAVLRDVADGVGAGKVSVDVSLSAEDADQTRLLLMNLVNTAIDSRENAADLMHLRRAWDRCTGYQPTLRERDDSGTNGIAVGSGYGRR